MKINELSPRSRATVMRIAKVNGLTPGKVLRQLCESPFTQKVTRHRIDLRAR